jgi:hypothetical protein
MLSNTSMFSGFVLLLLVQVCSGFAPIAPQRRSATARFMIMSPPPSVPILMDQKVMATTTIPSHALKEGLESFLSSSTTLSLEERHIPTAEEIAAKKLNFNLWFWGGGFVAPFLATM